MTHPERWAQRLRSALRLADTVTPRRVLWLNFGLSVSIGVWHGGSLLLAWQQLLPDAMAEAIKSVAAISLSGSALVGGSAAIALVWRRLQSPILLMHGIVLAAGAAAHVAWGAGMLVSNTWVDHFFWEPGLFTLSGCYAAWVLSRFSVPARLRPSAPVYFLPAAALALAALVDISVFLRLILTSE